jgi:hypothetical protein
MKFMFISTEDEGLGISIMYMHSMRYKYKIYLNNVYAQYVQVQNLLYCKYWVTFNLIDVRAKKQFCIKIKGHFMNKKTYI